MRTGTRTRTRTCLVSERLASGVCLSLTAVWFLLCLLSFWSEYSIYLFWMLCCVMWYLVWVAILVEESILVEHVYVRRVTTNVAPEPVGFESRCSGKIPFFWIVLLKVIPVSTMCLLYWSLADLPFFVCLFFGIKLKGNQTQDASRPGK